VKYYYYYYYYYYTDEMMNPTDRAFLPSMPIQTHLSFSPYVLFARDQTHHSILYPNKTNPPSMDFTIGTPGPGPGSMAASQRAMERTTKRALVGKRPHGMGMGKEAEEMEEEENVLEQESVCSLTLAELTVTAKYWNVWTSVLVALR